MSACTRCGSRIGEVNFCYAAGAWLCASCADPHLPRAPVVEEVPDEEPADPFTRPLDRLLLGLRWHAPDAYRLIPGANGEPDRWKARCPLHPDAGFTLALLERADGGVALACSAGCPETVIRSLLDPDAEREEIAAEVARWLVWAQTYRRAA